MIRHDVSVVREISSVSVSISDLTHAVQRAVDFVSLLCCISL